MAEARQIMTPGEQPPAVEPVKRKPGRPPKAAMAEARQIMTPGEQPPAVDDLAQYDSDELPPAPDGEMVSAAQVRAMLAEQAATFQAQMAAMIHASKASQDPATAARLARARVDETKLPTIEAAQAMCEKAVAAGQRPRSILTESGWYCHPEMARVKGAAGVAALGGEV